MANMHLKITIDVSFSMIRMIFYIEKTEVRSKEENEMTRLQILRSFEQKREEKNHISACDHGMSILRIGNVQRR